MEKTAFTLPNELVEFPLKLSVLFESFVAARIPTLSFYYLRFYDSYVIVFLLFFFVFDKGERES